MLSTPIKLDQFDRFRKSLECPDLLDELRKGLIGEDVAVPGPNGTHTMIYADYVASGRALKQIESFVANEVLPYYANSHTEASFCGQMMTRLRHQAREIILNSCGGDDRHAVIFTGAGATAGLNRLVGLFGVDPKLHDGKRPVVLIGPYEHHSNILPWRESGAKIIDIPEAPEGGPDLDVLEQALVESAGRLIVGTFSVTSNVTGIVTDVVKVTRMLKSYGALSIWDYAGGAPYLPIDMGKDTDAAIDAIAVSPHKFIGGPGASGILIVRRDAVTRNTPTLPGGGTVSFVSPWAHDYSTDVAVREEAGTPNVVGDLRAALCFMVKDAIGPEIMEQTLETFRQRALATWMKTPGLQILGNPNARHKLPIFSFRIVDPNGGYIHEKIITRLLSDLYGVQARGGCACAGPYGHRLLEIDAEKSAEFRTEILAGKEIIKPGWTRLGFSVLMTDAKIEKIIQAVDDLARNPTPACTDEHAEQTPLETA